jgi:hypothetical protein
MIPVIFLAMGANLGAELAFKVVVIGLGVFTSAMTAIAVFFF